jgi:hypothetical protein
MQLVHLEADEVRGHSYCCWYCWNALYQESPLDADRIVPRRQIRRDRDENPEILAEQLPFTLFDLLNDSELDIRLFSIDR